MSTKNDSKAGDYFHLSIHDSEDTNIDVAGIIRYYS
jgi:hypothetical protein